MNLDSRIMSREPYSKAYIARFSLYLKLPYKHLSTALIIVAAPAEIDLDFERSLGPSIR